MTGDRDRSLERLLRQSTGRLVPGAAGPCLDPETLAAWAEGALGGHDREAAEAHAAVCPRCQSMLAAFAAAVPAAAPEQRSRWRPWLGWLVPLSAAAAALVLWVAVPQPDADRQSGGERSAAPSAAATGVAEQPAAEALERRAETDGRAPAASDAAAPAARPDAVAGRARAATDAESVRRLQAAAQAPPGAAAATIEEQKLADSPAAAPAEPSREAMRDAAAPAAAFAAKAEAAPVEIRSPDASIRWRLTGRAVERSGDGGATWETLDVPGAPLLVAGASPAPGVAWLVGRQGTIVRTTDGRTFVPVPFPVAIALVGVAVADASAASVTAADGRTFATADAGRSWSRR